MEFKKERKMQGGIITVIVLIVIMTSGILVAGNSTIINDTVENIVEVVSKIEVWANTFIDIEPKENATVVLLYLDNGTSLPNQKIEFYLDGSLIDSQLTDSEGYAKLIFNPNVSLGTYFFKAEFQGNPSLYLNPSFAEGQIEITGLNGSREIMFIEQNFTESNITIETNISANQTFLTVYTDKPRYLENETINIFGEVLSEGEKINGEIDLAIEFNNASVYSSLIEAVNGSYSYSLTADFENEGEYTIKVSYGELTAETSFIFLKKLITLENLNCKEFKENILWSSSYSNKPQGSTTYQVWEPKYNCADIGAGDCYLENIEIKSRFLYFGKDNDVGEGYVQISEPDSSICSEPEKGNYLKHLSYEELKGESKSFEQYCGKSKKTKEKCEIETSTYRDYSTCYGIKAYGSQYMIVDAFEVKYYLCWEK